jgi:hypothetical protein
MAAYQSVVRIRVGVDTVAAATFDVRAAFAVIGITEKKPVPLAQAVGRSTFSTRLLSCCRSRVRVLWDPDLRRLLSTTFPVAVHDDAGFGASRRDIGMTEC